jgi:hypothetical protein
MNNKTLFYVILASLAFALAPEANAWTDNDKVNAASPGVEFQINLANPPVVAGDDKAAFLGTRTILKNTAGLATASANCRIDMKKAEPLERDIKASGRVLVAKAAVLVTMDDGTIETRVYVDDPAIERIACHQVVLKDNMWQHKAISTMGELRAILVNFGITFVSPTGPQMVETQTDSSNGEDSHYSVAI